jgi:hypothetical protein
MEALPKVESNEQILLRSRETAKLLNQRTNLPIQVAYGRSALASAMECLKTSPMGRCPSNEEWLKMKEKWMDKK